MKDDINISSTFAKGGNGTGAISTKTDSGYILLKTGKYKKSNTLLLTRCNILYILNV